MNLFGRTHDQPAQADELLAGINKPLPFSEEAENAVISCYMQNPEHLDDNPLAPEAFHMDSTRQVSALMLAMRSLGQLIDYTSVTNALRLQNKLDQIGGPSQIMEWQTFIPVPSHYPYYRGIVAQAFSRRETIRALAQSIKDMQDFGLDGNSDLPSALEIAKNRVLAIDLESDSAELPSRPIAQVITDVIERSCDRGANPGKLLGVSTGIPGLDKVSGGLQDGRFWSILAMSSDGKSSLCRQIIENACDQGHKCIIYTYEMMDEEEATRVLCSQAKVDSDEVTMGMFDNRANQDSFVSAVRKIQREWDLRIVDVAGKRLEQILRDIKRQKKNCKPGQKLIVEIDYIQLCQTAKDFKSRQLQIAYVTQSIKDCAKVNKCTILAPSQVNKDGDAREGMDIENDSDISLKIERVKADAGKKTPAWQKAKEVQLTPEDDRRRNLFVAKNRGGKRFQIIPLIFHGAQFRFEQAPQE